MSRPKRYQTRRTDPPHYGETVRFGERQFSEDRRRADARRNKELLAVVALAGLLLFLGVVAFVNADVIVLALIGAPGSGGFACFIGIVLLLMVCSVILLTWGDRSKRGR